MGGLSWVGLHWSEGRGRDECGRVEHPTQPSLSFSLSLRPSPPSVPPFLLASLNRAHSPSLCIVADDDLLKQEASLKFYFLPSSWVGKGGREGRGDEVSWIRTTMIEVDGRRADFPLH